MTTRRAVLEDDLSCPICGKIFQEPVVLFCKHRFCKPCLESSWVGGGACECPLCCQPSSMGELIVNTMLKKSCEGYLKERRKSNPFACKEHGESLTLFCLEDLQPTCVECKESGSHKGHRLYSLEEASQDCKVCLDERASRNLEGITIPWTRYSWYSLSIYENYINWAGNANATPVLFIMSCSTIDLLKTFNIYSKRNSLVYLSWVSSVVCFETICSSFLLQISQVTDLVLQRC